MSDLPPDKPQEPEQTLCYATPTRVRPAGDVPLVGQMAIGCASWVMVIILTFVGARQFGIGNLLILPSVMLVLLIVLSLWARSRWRCDPRASVNS